MFWKLVVILGILIPISVGATSGSCSYHGGVNCAYGPDYDGSVMCNDRWSESSVSYVDSDECQAQASCNNNEYSSLLEKYNINDLKSQYASTVAEINLIKADLQVALVNAEKQPMTMQRLNGEKNRLIKNANDRITPLIAKADSIQSELQSNLTKVESECDAIGRDRIQNLVSLRAQQQIKEQQRINTEKQQTINIPPQSFIKPSEPIKEAVKPESRTVIAPIIKLDAPKVFKSSYNLGIKKAVTQPKQEIKPTTTISISTSTSTTSTLILKEPITQTHIPEKQNQITKLFKFILTKLTFWK